MALRNRHMKIAERLTEHTHHLPALTVGDTVRIQNQLKLHPTKWDKTGVVIEVWQPKATANTCAKQSRALICLLPHNKPGLSESPVVTPPTNEEHGKPWRSTRNHNKNCTKLPTHEYCYVTWSQLIYLHTSFIGFTITPFRLLLNYYYYYFSVLDCYTLNDLGGHSEYYKCYYKCYRYNCILY